MAQIMSDEQRLAILEDYRPQEHLISVGKNKDNSPVLYYPAAWRLYELRLRHPFFTLEAEIIHMDEEQGTVIVKAIGYDGLDYASSNLKGTALKQGQLKELDKVETKAKSRVARDIGIGTEYALDMDADETDGVHQPSTAPRSSRNGNAPRSLPATQPAAQPPYRAIYDEGVKRGAWTRETFYATASSILDGFPVNANNVKALSQEQLHKLQRDVERYVPVEKAS